MGDPAPRNGGGVELHMLASPWQPGLGMLGAVQGILGEII